MCKNAADDSSTRRQTPSRASAASKTLESRRTNTRQFQNFVFAQLRSVFHQGIRASPQIFEALLLQPARNFFSVLRRESFNSLMTSVALMMKTILTKLLVAKSVICYAGGSSIISCSYRILYCGSRLHDELRLQFQFAC